MHICMWDILAVLYMLLKFYHALLSNLIVLEKKKYVEEYISDMISWWKGQLSALAAVTASDLLTEITGILFEKWDVNYYC